MFPLQLIWFTKRSFIFFLSVSFITGYVLSQLFSGAPKLFQFSGGSNDAVAAPADTSSILIRRIESYELVKPIVSAEPSRESAAFAPLKNQLQSWVDSLKAAGTVSAVSIHLESLQNENWMEVNPEEPFHPASFLKVPLMIGFLQKAQANPGLLEEKVVFRPVGSGPANILYFPATKELVPGKTYTFREILEYMIAYSDNNASRLLSQYVEFPKVQKLFTDLSLKAADPERSQMMLYAGDFSFIMKSIFNASLLNPDYSELAAGLLAKSTFEEGFRKGFPAGTKMWHKFGEWNAPGTDFELNETGVVFLNNKPYLLTVLTKGKDMKKLPGVIATAGKKVSDHLLRNP